MKTSLLLSLALVSSAAQASEPLCAAEAIQAVQNVIRRIGYTPAETKISTPGKGRSGGSITHEVISYIQGSPAWAIYSVKLNADTCQLIGLFVKKEE